MQGFAAITYAILQASSGSLPKTNGRDPSRGPHKQPNQSGVKKSDQAQELSKVSSLYAVPLDTRIVSA